MYKKGNNYIIRKESDNEYLFYNVESDTVFTLNQVGYIIYSNAISENKEDDIVQSVCKETGDNPDTARDIILAFISDLEKEGILY